MKKRVLIIDSDGKRIHQFSYCLNASKSFEIFVLLHHNVSDILKYSRFVKKIIRHQYDNDDLVLHIIKICKEHKIDVIFGLSLDTIGYLIKHKNQLLNVSNLQLLPTQEVFEITNDKEKLGHFLKINGLDAPATWPAENYLQDLDKMTFPVLLKPKRGEGGKGIFKSDTLEKLKEKLKEIQLSDYIIQDFVLGYDIDCSLLARDGKILFHTIQRGIEESKYNEFSPFSAIEFLDAADLFITVTKFIEKINFTGIAHLDLRYNQNTKKYVIIEINSRYWDTLVGSFLVGAINFPLQHVKASLGGVITDRVPFKFGFFLSTRAYALYMINRLKIPAAKGEVKLRQSGLYFKIADPIYFIINFIKGAINKIKKIK